MNSKKILLVGGGTGGHMMPLLPLAAEAKKNNWKVSFLFSEGFVERKIYEQNFCSYEVFFVKTEKIRRYLSWQNLLLPFTLVQSFLGTVKILQQIKPNAVFLKGSAISFHVLLAVKLLNLLPKNKIKIFAHESDTSPSLSMKWCTQWADKVFASFGEVMRPLFYTENREQRVESREQREELGGENYQRIENREQRTESREQRVDLGSKSGEVKYFSSAKKNILIFGGSQGALFLNQAVERNLENLLKEFNVTLITGGGKQILVNREQRTESREKRIDDREPRVDLGSTCVETQYFSSLVGANQCVCPGGTFQQFELLPAAEFDRLLDEADLVICRSGASVFQVLARHKKSLLIPYPYAARDHQLTNAQFFAERGLAYLVEEKNLRQEPDLFLTQIKKLAADEALPKRLKQANIQNSAVGIFAEIRAQVGV